MRAIRIILGLSLITLGALSFATEVLLAEETIIVDFTADEVGPATANANGFWGEVLDGFPSSLLDPLRPVGFKGRVDNEITDDDSTLYKLNAIAAAEGNTAYYIVGLYNGKWLLNLKNDCTCERDPDNDCLQQTLHWEVDIDLWDCWIEWVLENVAIVDSLQSVYPNVRFHYSLWNEPDLIDFWLGTDLQFYEMWEATYDTIRNNAVGTATITGPAFFSYHLEQPGSPGRTYWKGFLEYCHPDSNDCLPDVYDFHSFDHADTTLRNQNNFLDEILAIKTFMKVSTGIDTVGVEFQIGEMMDDSPCSKDDGCGTGKYPQYMQPGSIIRHFALAERSRKEGLLFAFRSVWRESWNGECVACQDECEEGCEPGTPWERGRLGGIVDPVHPAVTLDKRYAWWVYKAYADMSGVIVGVDSTLSVDALASRDDQQSEARVLIGGFHELDSDTLSIQIKSLRDIEGLVVNDVVHALVLHMPGGENFNDAGVQPLTIFSDRRLVFGDSLDIEVTGFGEYDAISIELTPIQPDTIPAPG